METGNQPPKAPITEESTAKLDVLCELCQSLFQDTVCVHSTTLNCALRHGQYHHHITELRRSAADGCHLCNILLYQIDIDDWSFPDDFPKDNFTPWIMLCVDEGYRITGDNDGTSLGDGAGSPDVFRLSGKRNYLLLHRERPREQIGSIGSFSLECLETAEPDDFRTISSKTNSQESFKLMRSWITECLTNHKECSTIMERCGNHTPPTRLLDLTQMNSRSIVRLVETTSLTNKPSYMTLSHCWGNMKCLTLTYDNFDELKAGFSADRLPKTFREAVITATSLNCFYIWIDSLCIMQDSIEDWMIESATMNNVYSNAYLNIAAGLAKHSEEGLFRERNALPLAACHIKTSCSCTTEEWISCTGSISGVDSGPLHDRAWVVQELLLSPRVLTFGREQLGWQCFEKSCTETDLDASYYNRPKRWIAGLETWNRGTLNLNGPNIGTWQSFRESSWRDSPIYVWQQITQSYCRTGLTFERDKLVAISGIANKMDKSTQGQLGSYLSGLWEHDLWKQLTWKADPGVCRRPAVYRAPSWSWASVEGPVRASNGPVQETCRYVMTIIEAKTTALQDPFGAVTAGHLKVSGKLCCISLREKEPIKPVLKPSAPKDSDGTDSDDDESDEGSWCPWDRVDIQGAVFEGPDLWASADDHNAWLQFQKDRTPLYIMPVYEEQDWGLTAFVLRPTGQKDGQFSRVGLVDPYKEGIVKALNEAMVSQVLPDELHQGLDELGMYMIEIV